MNIKLVKNPVIDLFIILIDILLVVFCVEISDVIIYSFTGIYYKTIFSMITFLVGIIFMFYTYEFYTKMIRNKYEIVLSVGISVVVSTVFVIICESIFTKRVAHSSPLLYIVLPCLAFVILSTYKLLLLRFVKEIEGVAKLLVIESKFVENSLARKVKYSYCELYEAWYIQIDINSQEEIYKLINETFDLYDSIFISPNIPNDTKNLFISKAVNKRKEIYILPDLYNISTMKNETVQFDDTPALRIKPFGLTKLQSIIKRLFDITISLLGIIISSPIMLICAIAIKLDSKGCVIYKQERLTIFQKPFNVYKFRTMREDAEKITGAVLAIDNDPRITKVGKILRSLRLDELPQLFNILRGSMSVVGPRPERPHFIEQFLENIENYDKRFFCKAGLTGLAQVYAKYETDVKDKTLYDLLYIKDYSFWLDIKLILLTIKIMFVRESSNGIKEKPDYSKIGSGKDV